MAGYYKTEGVVLRSMRLREADRIVHLYTGTHGRVNAVVKGVRRTKSRFGGAAGAVPPRATRALRGPGELHTVTQAEAVEWYPRLREHGGAILAAGTACESVLRMFGDGEANAAAYNLLCHELQLLDARPEAAGPANLLAFRLKLLLAAGFLPELSRLRALRRAAGRRVSPLLLRRRRRDLRATAARATASRWTSPRARSWRRRSRRPLKDGPDAPRPALTQVERAVSGTLEYHAHVRLRSVA